MGLRALYVGTIRGLRHVCDRLGVLGRLEASQRPALRHLRTLFAIYDAEDLAALDLPWWSYASIRRVEQFLRDNPAARVFEFGAGASTVWLARRAHTVVSVEHDLQFAADLSTLVAGHDNVTLFTVPPEPAVGQAARTPSQRRGFEGLDFTRYVSVIDEQDERFDLIVIDGRARVQSLARARQHLAKDGLIVFDDVERRRYRSALEQPGWLATVYRGLGPCLPLPTSTAVLQRKQ